MNTIDHEKAIEAINAIRELAEDIRTWCSPHGVSATYADRIEETLSRVLGEVTA